MEVLITVLTLTPKALSNLTEHVSNCVIFYHFSLILFVVRGLCNNIGTMYVLSLFLFSEIKDEFMDIVTIKCRSCNFFCSTKAQLVDHVR